MDGPDRYDWRGHASGEGGPMLVADLEDYLFWGGAEERWEESSLYRIHSYGPFIRRLPPRFQPQGPEEWHQEARIPTLAGAQAYLRELIETVQALEPSAALRDQLPMTPKEILEKSAAAFNAPPGADVSERLEWMRAWRDHLEQGIDFTVGPERIFHVDLSPDTDYARGCHGLKGDAARVSFGPGKHGVLWEMEGGGTADLAIAPDHQEFLLLRTWVDDDTGRKEARTFVEGATEEKGMADVGFASGTVAVVWAPVQPADPVEGREPGPWLRAEVMRRSPFQLSQPGLYDIGVLFKVEPGDYRVACGTHEADAWSCRWARFGRVST